MYICLSPVVFGFGPSEMFICSFLPIINETPAAQISSLVVQRKKDVRILLLILVILHKYRTKKKNTLRRERWFVITSAGVVGYVVIRIRYSWSQVLDRPCLAMTIFLIERDVCLSLWGLKRVCIELLSIGVYMGMRIFFQKGILYEAYGFNVQVFIYIKAPFKH